MSESELNELFSRRLRFYMNEYRMTQSDLAKRIGVGTSTVSHWYHAERTPRSDALEKLCEVFKCKTDDLITEKTPQQYYEEETAAIAEQIANNKELRMLMDAARDTDPKTIEELHNYLLYLKNKELHTEG